MGETKNNKKSVGRCFERHIGHCYLYKNGQMMVQIRQMLLQKYMATVG
jgi:hypothetical protein